MSALSIRLPRSLHEQLRRVAREEGVSVNQFVLWAISEKIARLQALEEELQARARRGSREKLRAALAQVPAWEPLPHDAPDTDA